jgi:hypothetical protein
MSRRTWERLARVQKELDQREQVIRIVPPAWMVAMDEAHARREAAKAEKAATQPPPPAPEPAPDPDADDEQSSPGTPAPTRRSRRRP